MIQTAHHIDLTDLPEEYRQVAEIIGMPAYMALVKTFGGGAIYIPKAQCVTRESRNRAIRSEFNGRNYRELAKRYNLTARWVRVILAEKTDHAPCVRPLDTQLQLF